MARPKRDKGGRWQKGHSGNPTGATTEEQQARIVMMRGLAGLAPDAVERLGLLLKSDDERVALGAVKVVVEHIIGKEKVQADHPAMPTAIVIDGYTIQPRKPPEPVQDEAAA